MNKKIFSFLLAFILVISLCGCAEKVKEKNTSSKVEKIETSDLSNFDLLYCTRDTFDPYSCKTKQNFEICYLLFDPLVKTDNEFNAKNVLAESVSLKGKLCTVVLKDVDFTDGTSVTADDVVFSFKKAKKSKSVYKYSLKNAVSITKTGEKTVSFALSKEDPYFMNVLDFPILKSGSDKLKNSDNKSLPPIGSGRYSFDEDYTALTVNKNYHGTVPAIKKIGLADSPDEESSYHNIEIGIIDYYYSNLKNGRFPKMNGNKSVVNLNNLVFLGINFNNAYLKNIQFRQALSSAIDRTDLAEKAYFTNANAALGPFPTVWEPAKDYQSISEKQNKEIAISNLEDLKITKKNSKGNYLSGSNAVSLNLIVNKKNSVRVAAAKQIAKELTEFGIKINVEKLSYNEYNKRIKAKNFDLYIGEMRISNNMDLTELLTFVSKNGYKAAKKSKSSKRVSALSAVNKYYSKDYSLGDMLNVFNSELPIIPLVHRTGLTMYTTNIKSSFNPSNSDLFYGLESIK